jgi:hypothetical protein
MGHSIGPVSRVGSTGLENNANLAVAAGSPWGADDMQIAQEQLTRLKPLIDEAAELNDFTPDQKREFQALILQEIRGQKPPYPGGAGQIGFNEINSLKGTHPELDGVTQGNHLEDRFQILGAAAYFKQGDFSLSSYNAGPNSGGRFNDPAYTAKHAEALAVVDALGIM